MTEFGPLLVIFTLVPVGFVVLYFLSWWDGWTAARRSTQLHAEADELFAMLLVARRQNLPELAGSLAKRWVRTILAARRL